MDRERLMKMAASVRTGGKGTVRRKRKSIHKTTTKEDDKRIQSTLRKLNLQELRDMDEVNIFKDDLVIQFEKPNVQLQTSTGSFWVISGRSQTRKLEDLFPGISNQLGSVGQKKPREEEEEEDEVPQLVADETFEAVADESQAS